jgi:hypothetical protein
MGWIQVTGPRKADDVWITCSRCGGGGSERDRDNEPTDRAHLGSETASMAYRGYIPTNLCDQCGGEGGTWLPKSKNKNRLNVSYNESGQWQTALLQTWWRDEGGWEPKLTDDQRSQYRWKYDSDSDPEQWEDAQ